MMATVLEELDDEFPFLNIVKVNTEECPVKSEEFHINGIPDMYFYKNGKIVRNETGYMNMDEIRGIIAGIFY